MKSEILLTKTISLADPELNKGQIKKSNDDIIYNAFKNSDNNSKDLVHNFALFPIRESPRIPPPEACRTRTG